MLVHTKTLGYSVKEFLCDNGGEFDNKDVHEICIQMELLKRLTAPYTPEQNGASEREMKPPLKWPEHSNIQILRSVSLQLSG
ncbi:hypothetical protein TNCV_4651931 [Trichonephila clavipes]|nr:hypothetical protein TNCV_4651931 [Trichonephila clavipes]